jgi:adenylate cyclase
MALPLGRIMADREVKRRLAAILAADVAGYTRLMEADTDATVAAWQAAREDVIKPSVAGHSGTIVKLTGDGFLVEFPNVQDAVTCAIVMQEGLAASSLDFRMGVNMGDIVDDGEDIHGEGVNIAARLEGLADAGGINISGMVYDTIRNRIEANYEDRGEQDVKNVSAPVRVYAIRLGSSAGPAPSFDQAVSDKPSVAVLPFENLSGDPEQEYFSDGITEDIITALGRTRWFYVISRNITANYRSKTADAGQVAGELDADYVVAGSVRRSQVRIIISAQVVDGKSGKQIWAERYDIAGEDIFTLQDQIAETLASVIEPEVSKEELRRARTKPPSNLSAWDRCLRAWWHRFKQTPEDFAEARGHFEKAIEMDPMFSVAYAGLAEVMAYGLLFQFFERSAELRDKAVRLAKKAVALDPDDPTNYVALGRVLTVTGQPKIAIRELERAIELNPHLAVAHYQLGAALVLSGRAEEAIPVLEHARAINPRDMYVSQIHAFLARAHLALKRYEKAKTEAEEALRYPMTQWPVNTILVSALGHLGDRDACAEARAALFARKPEFTIVSLQENHAGIFPADGLEIEIDGLRKAGVPEGGVGETTSPPLSDKPSVAVLPFDNLSNDPEQEYFSDGITEDIITGLSRVRQFFVIARNTTFTFKGQAVDVPAMASDLGVRYVLEGSVRKSGARLRITVQLIDGETGNHLWAERYEHEIEDIFEIQDEITAAVVGAIAPELARAEQDRARNKSPEYLDAWDYFQRGMWHFNKMSTEEVAEARRLFEAAANCAPEFSGALAALGYVAAVEALSGYTEDRAATLEAGLRDAERAVALDDRDGFNQFALGRVAIVAGQTERAVAALEKAIQLNPSSAQAHYGLGVAHFWAGRAAAALPYLDQAVRLSPYDPHLWSFHYLRGNARHFAGDTEGAVADQKTAIQNKGDEYLPHLSLAFMLGQTEGRGGDAQAAYDAALKLKPELSAAFLRATLGNLDPPMLEALLEGLKQFGLPDE